MRLLTYTLAVALVVAVTALAGVPVVPWLVIEYHLPRMFQAALDGSGGPAPWLNLAATTLRFDPRLFAVRSVAKGNLFDGAQGGGLRAVADWRTPRADRSICHDCNLRWERSRAPA